MDYLAHHKHIHPVDCIVALVRVDHILRGSPELDIDTRRHDDDVDEDNNNHPMNYRQTNVIHQHGRLLQMPQSIEIAAKISK